MWSVELNPPRRIALLGTNIVFYVENSYNYNF